MAKIKNGREYALAVRRQQEVLNGAAPRNFALNEVEASEMATLDSDIREYLSAPAVGSQHGNGQGMHFAAGTSG